MAEATPVLELAGITKRFPGIVANDAIDFDLRRGEVHALLGENGAGKSTLMNVLYGLYRPDEGEIRVGGNPVSFHSPKDAIDHGIGMVHQHFMLIPVMTVAENIVLGTEPVTNGVFLDHREARHRVRELAETFGFAIDPDAKVEDITVGQQQRVEILKALYRGAAALILDEPTAVLTPQEVDELFGTLRRMAAEGHALIFISHKLHEVLAISDRVTVLRDGHVVQTLETKTTSRPELARLMVGREVLLRVDRPPVELGPVRLRLEDVVVIGDRGLPAVRGAGLEVRQGEILGLAGVSGNGQRELADAIAGLRKTSQGHILVDDIDVTGWNPGRRIDHGLAYIPEERMRDGVIKELSVEENLMAEDHGRPPYARGIFLDFRRIAGHCDDLIQGFEIKTPSRATPLRNLSGGNIQKLILARELSRQPVVLIAAQPTRGVDIGSTEYIHRRLIEQRSRGTATLLISEDLDEIRNLSDRIAVMYEGRIIGVVGRAQATVEEIGLMMAGVAQAA
jgi:simple sugar transport system ATP-binding protein